MRCATSLKRLAVFVQHKAIDVGDSNERVLEINPTN